MTILENNCMQSTASSAGYSTGGTLISAFAAYMMLNRAPLPISLMLAWVFFLAVMGVTMAIPMKRQMINIEQLRFPSGIAAAETLRALHSHGAKAARAAKALGIAGMLAARRTSFWTDGLRRSSAHKLEPFSLSALVDRFNEMVFGKAWIDRTVLFELGPDFPGGRRADRPARLGQHDARRNALLGGLRAHPPAPGHHHRHRVYAKS